MSVLEFGDWREALASVVNPLVWEPLWEGHISFDGQVEWQVERCRYVAKGGYDLRRARGEVTLRGWAPDFLGLRQLAEAFVVADAAVIAHLGES